MTSVLRNPRHELYAQGVAAGLRHHEAYMEAGYKCTNKVSLTQACKRLHADPTIKRRIEELLKASAAKSELTRKNILDRIFQDWELARKLGQVPAALKAAELMGREMHKMFTERKEVGGPGDFDNKSEEELKEIIKKELGDLGWDEDNPLPPSALN